MQDYIKNVRKKGEKKMYNSNKKVKIDRIVVAKENREKKNFKSSNEKN